MNKHSRFTPNTIKLAVLALALALAGAGSAIAANAPATSRGTVVTPIEIEAATELVFGSFAPGAASGTVTISTSGDRTATGVTLVGTAAGAAQFNVTGTAGLNYGITLSGTTLTSGANNMTFAPVSDLTGAGATSGTADRGTLSAGGTQTIYVGGVLTVAANQAEGEYTGSLTATVEYE